MAVGAAAARGSAASLSLAFRRSAHPPARFQRGSGQLRCGQAGAVVALHLTEPRALLPVFSRLYDFLTGSGDEVPEPLDPLKFSQFKGFLDHRSQQKSASEFLWTVDATGSPAADRGRRKEGPMRSRQPSAHRVYFERRSRADEGLAEVVQLRELPGVDKGVEAGVDLKGSSALTVLSQPAEAAAARARAMSVIMSSWPPTILRRPTSTRIARVSRPCRRAAASAWRRKLEYTPA